MLIASIHTKHKTVVAKYFANLPWPLNYSLCLWAIMSRISSIFLHSFEIAPTSWHCVTAWFLVVTHPVLWSSTHTRTCQYPLLPRGSPCREQFWKDQHNFRRLTDIFTDTWEQIQCWWHCWCCWRPAAWFATCWSLLLLWTHMAPLHLVTI